MVKIGLHLRKLSQNQSRDYHSFGGPLYIICYMLSRVKKHYLDGNAKPACLLHYAMHTYYLIKNSIKKRALKITKFALWHFTLSGGATWCELCLNRCTIE